MFIGKAETTYLTSGEQRTKGYYLYVMQPEVPNYRNEAYAIVRMITLKQVGHFMMGTINVGPHTFTVSGNYGSDGLFDRVPNDVARLGVPVPRALVAEFMRSNDQQTDDVNYKFGMWGRANSPTLKATITLDGKRYSARRSRYEYVREYNAMDANGNVEASFVYCDTHSHHILPHYSPTGIVWDTLGEAERTNFAYLVKGVPVSSGVCVMCNRKANVFGHVTNNR